MKTTRKILLALVIALAFVAVFAVAAFAAMPTGQTKAEATEWEENYADIAEGDGWVLLTTTDSLDPLCRVQSGEETTTLVKAPGGKFYYNKTLKKVVVIGSGTLAGDYADATSVSASSFTKSIPVAYCIEDKWEAIEAHFVSGDTAWSYKIQGTGYPTTIGGEDTGGGTGTLVYVIKSDYEKMKAAFDEIDADTTLTDEEKKLAKVEVAVPYASRYHNKNVAEEGAMWTLGYLFMQMAADQTNYPFETLEFRVAKGGSLTLQNFAFILQNADSVKTIMLDSRIVSVAPQPKEDGSRGLFRSLAKLVSLGHVVYEDYSGNFKTGVEGATFVDGKVNVSGFTKITTTGHYGIFIESSSITDVIWFDSFKYGSAETAGNIDDVAFKNCTSLKTITLTAPLTAIKANAFNTCSALTTIDLKGGVAAGATVDSTAFTKATQDITVYVYTSLDEAKANALFAGFENITVVNKSPLKNPVISEGFQIRVHDYSGLRSIFTLDASVVAENTGYTLADYGVITFSEATLLNAELYNNDLGALLADALSANPTNATKVYKTSVMEANRFVEVFDANETVEGQMYADEVGDKTFCVTLTNIPDKNVMDAVYSVAYTVWEGTNGTDYTFTIYASENEDTLGKSAFSLYDVTVSMFVNGVVNTQTVTDDKGNVWQCCLWDVLDNGALSVTASDVTTPNTNLTVGYAFTDEDGDETTAETFTYANKPLRAWKMCRVSSRTVDGVEESYLELQNTTSWNSVGHYVEGDNTNTTNVVWSLLKYNDSLIAVYRRDPDATASEVAMIPSLCSTAAPAPFDASYFGNSKLVDSTGILIDGSSANYTAGLLRDATVYTPILSAANEAKITTLVIDYGVNSLNIRPFDFASVATLDTIVYPEGVSGGGQIFQGCKKVSTVIFASDSKASLTAATQVEGFGNIVDLSGLVTLGSSNFAFSGATLFENIILPKAMKWNSGAQEFLNGCSSLKRVWTIGQDVPDAGVVDLSMVTQGVLGFCKNALTDIPAGTTFILPSSFRGVSNSAYNLKEANPSSQAFGVDTAYTFDLGSNIGALYYSATTEDYGILQYYDKLKSLGSSDARYDNIDKITVVCDVEVEGVMVEYSMSIADWRTYCVAQGLYTPAS